jgi:2-amino-4-hydroxy-6-hydroxymethyldihydropteridine diphosphokinase
VNTPNPPQQISVYIALGTNLGDRAANLQNAIEALSPLVDVLTRSPVYQTPPWGYEDQPDFLNQVVLAQTALAPKDLLAHLKNIETTVGRTPSFRYGPRLVDLDILFYGDEVFKMEGLEIPHPRIPERAFVLVPLNDLNPDLQHPTLKVSIQEMLQQVDTTGILLFDP